MLLTFINTRPCQHLLASQKEQSCSVVCTCMCVFFCFRLNQLCSTKAIKAYGSGHCPLKTKRVNPCSLALTHSVSFYRLLPRFAQAYQGLACYGNKSKNSLWDSNRSKSSTLDGQTQSRHVSTAPWDPASQINQRLLLNLHKTNLHPLGFVRTTGGLVMTDYDWHPCRAESTACALQSDKSWLNFLSEDESALGA